MAKKSEKRGTKRKRQAMEDETSSNENASDEPVAKRSTPAKSIPQDLSFRDAAIKVLTDAKGPLSAKEICERMIEQGLITTVGKTPDRTVAARIYSEIKTKPSESAFCQVGRGVFGLTSFSKEERENLATPPAAPIIRKKQKPRKRKVKSNDASPISRESKKRGLKSRAQETENADDENVPELQDEAKTTETTTTTTTTITTIPKAPPKPTNSFFVPSLPPAIGNDGMYNDSFGYLFLRYFLDVTKRQECSTSTPEDDCYICKNGGELICCDYPQCCKVYHLNCLGLEKVPQGKWYCPWHTCATCRSASLHKPAVHQCATCTNAYCQDHLQTDQTKPFRKGYIVCSTCMPYFAKEIEDDEE